MADLPIIILKKIEKKNNIIKTILEVPSKYSAYLSDPIAPASISRNKNILPLHKFIKKSGNIYEFETYDYDGKLPEIEKKYKFQSWFTEKQIKLIKNKKIKWKLSEFPKDGNVCYDDISWDSIPPAGETQGYTDGKHWITKKTYNEYIKKDIFNLRKNTI
jgi:hypothetical protein